VLLRNREREELATAKRVTTLEGDEKAYFVRRLRTGQAKASPPVAFCCPVDSKEPRGVGRAESSFASGDHTRVGESHVAPPVRA
jgi:hypothetical protein